jgi:hypothetical protein
MRIDSHTPCNLDHNGECLVCDCWISACGWKRLLENDFKWESKEQLLEIFKDFLKNHPKKNEIENGKN